MKTTKRDLENEVAMLRDHIQVERDNAKDAERRLAAQIQVSASVERVAVDRSRELETVKLELQRTQRALVVALIGR